MTATAASNPDNGQDGYRSIRAYGYSDRGEWRWALWERVSGHLRRVGTAKTRAKAENFLQGDPSYSRDLDAAKSTRPNPSLILVAGNPRPPAEVERAWCKFHQRDSFGGTVRDVGKIAGAPDYAFALGRCVDVDLGRGPQRFTPMPWLVCDPRDDSLWIVAEKALKLGNGIAGSDVRAVTYAPTASSGKDVANFRHKFSEPMPTFCPVGNLSYCRAIMLNGGQYRVAGEEWIYD